MFFYLKHFALFLSPVIFPKIESPMPYNPALDERLQRITEQWPDFERKKMFGGTGYLLNGNMVTGVYKDLLVLRVGKDLEQELLTQPWCRPMDITGKPMKGWLFVEANGWDNDQRLDELVTLAKVFVGTLPAKK